MIKIISLFNSTLIMIIFIVAYMYCLLNRDIIRNNKVLMIINFAWKNYECISFINNVYIPFFKKYFKYKIDTVFYGPEESKKYKIFRNGLKENGYYSYKSVIMAYENNKNYFGYLFINDDGFLNPILFNIYNFSNIIIESVHYINISTTNWYFVFKKNELNVTYYKSFNKVIEIICSNTIYRNSKLCKSYYPSLIIGGWSDFFYIPNYYVKEIVDLMKIFYKNYVFLESTITTISQLYNYEAIWKKCSLNKLYYLYTCPFIHPVKYSISSNQKIIQTIINHYNSKFDFWVSPFCYFCNVTPSEYITSGNGKTINFLRKNHDLINLIYKQ